MAHHRFRLPEEVKERQARDLKRRFSAYLGEPPRKRTRQAERAQPANRLPGLVIAALLAFVAYVLWKWRG